MQEKKKKKSRKAGASVQEMTERRQADGWKHTAIQQRRKNTGEITGGTDHGGAGRRWEKGGDPEGEEKRGGVNRKVTHSKQQTGSPAARWFSV